VREVVGRVFADVDRFQLGDMADAAELLDSVLLVLHDAAAGTGEEDCQPPCLVHSSFGTRIVETTGRCDCGSDGESQSHIACLHYFPASLLIPTDGKPPALEDRIHAYFCSDMRTCGLCGERQGVVTKVLESSPEIFAFVLAWSSHSVEKSWLESALLSIPERLDLQRVYPISGREAPAPYNLKGLICFYGGHYVCFFLSSALQHWVYFDDANVRTVGTLTQVFGQMVSGRLLPLVIFLTRADPAP
jgi:hypothetical protein